MNTQNVTGVRKFTLVNVLHDEHMYELHDFNCKAKMHYAESRADARTVYGVDAEDSLVETKEWLAGDWGYWPSDKEFKIHDCSRK